ncbi:MAG: NTP transferase domain-containing protein, partial [Muribaculaceae bacterium]|nr:NTP transferase domain-containing protein [Muribaculaceae bacterium]
MDFVILAGGQGNRFVDEGFDLPKPLIPVMGEPMIGRLVSVLMECGAESIHVGANARMDQLIEYLGNLQKHGLPIKIHPIVTDNSYSTLQLASEDLTGRFIALTCDAIFPKDEFARYVRKVESSPSGVALMGLTRFVEDGSPLYAKVSGSGEIVDYRYGGKPFVEDLIVSAGIYGLSGEIMDAVSEFPREPQSLNDFQRE